MKKVDCFHIIKRLREGFESMRLKFKRLAVTESKKAAAAFAKNEGRKGVHTIARDIRRKLARTRGVNASRSRSISLRNSPMETQRWNC